MAKRNDREDAADAALAAATLADQAQNNSALQPAMPQLPAIPGATPGIVAGLENVEQGDLSFPRLMLVQPLSRCVSGDDPAAPRPGQFANSLTLEAINPPIIVVPIYHHKMAAKYPPGQGDPIEGMSRNGKEGNKFGLCGKCAYNYKIWDDHTPPSCTLMHTFTCLKAADSPDPSNLFLITMMKSSSGAARKWLSSIQFSGLPASFCRRYELGREEKKNDKGRYYVWTVRPAGNVEEPMKYADLYRSLNDAFSAGRLTTDMEGAPDRPVNEDEKDIPF